MDKDVKQRAQQIREWFDACDPTTTQTHDALKRAARILFQYQTLAEQDGNHTHDKNGIGFNRTDADFGRRIVRTKGTITDKMALGAKKMLRKYANQLAAHALRQEARQPAALNSRK